MPLPIYVDGYPGFRANERPKQFTCDEDIHEIVAIEVKRQHPDVEFFQVRTTDDKRYVLRYDPHEDVWTLESDFDGPELLARPGIEVVTVGAAQIREAASRIDGCEHCRPDDAEIPFDWILSEVTGCLLFRDYELSAFLCSSESAWPELRARCSI